jgi:asparagine synthase (glutamine-hydrolysing)
MCGISGIYHPRDLQTSWDLLVQKMSKALFHRGPDEYGFYHDDCVSLGISRLNVIDLETGSQPISNEDGTLHIIANCEIYNFETIRSDLVGSHRFKTKSDVEVLLHLYEEYQLDFFNHFDGMFAFALWDSIRQRLVLARDRFGIKPLFFTIPDINRTLAFASELEPLLLLPQTSRDIDPTAIDEFFALSYIPHPHTIYQSIKKLNPASYMVVENGKISTHQYWKLKNIKTIDDSLGLEELDNAIERSVRSMMRSDVPIGAFLSGGLDSSIVVYHMAKNSDNPVRTFSLRFSEKQSDEGDLAASTSRSLGTSHHEVWGRPEDLLLFHDLVSHFGEPLADPSQIPTYLICREARKYVKVLLSGEGGDEILGGYPAYCASLIASRIPCLPSSWRLPIRRNPRFLPKYFPRLARTEGRLRKFLNGYQLPGIRRHAFWRTIMSPSSRRSIYSREFLTALPSGIDCSIFQALDALISFNGMDDLTRYQHLDIMTYLTDNCLAKVDRVSMANALEVRVPLLDLKVFGAAMQLSTRLRVNGLQTKVALRRIMKGRIPEKVRRMPKRGFPVPLGIWFRGPLQKYVEATLAPQRIKKLPILSSHGVQNIVQQHLNGTANLEREIWSLICFVHWYEQCFN